MAPLPWVRRIAQVVPELNQIPLFGKAPPFDWHHFTSALMDSLSISGLEIRKEEQDWREGGEIRKGLGRELISLSVSVAPLGHVLWMMSYEDAAKLGSWIMKPGSKTKSLTSEVLQEGFYRYLLLECLNVVQEMEPFQGLSLHVGEEEELVDMAFCIDVEIKMDHRRSCWGRLAIPKEFQKAWIEHFSHLPSEYIPTQMSRTLPITAGLKIGSVSLSREEWGKLQEGDFVLLDHASYHLKEKRGSAVFMLRSTPLFNVHLEKEKGKLAGYALHDEEKMDQSREEEPRALKEIPVQVNVEIARLRMTLDELVHLAPGNQIELPLGTEDAVSLVVNGEKVGSAELVYLGEKLGLRILEIG